MPRKYKFFIKNKSVVFTDDRAAKNGMKLSKSEWYEAFDNQSLKVSCVVYCEDLKGWMEKLAERYDFVLAGGGFVKNDKDELLMIHRRGYWDLPKGKLEPDESIKRCAKREVEEETGVGSLKIKSTAFVTFHLYFERKKTAIKESHWFLMSSKSKKKPVAQTEEDILRAEWVKLPVKKKIFREAYASIQDVIDHYSGIL